MFKRLRIFFILIFYPFFVFTQNIDTLAETKNIDNSNFKEFSISYCNSTYTLDSIGNISITSDVFNHYFKVNSGIYKGKLSKEKLEVFKTLLAKYKILEFSNNQALYDFRNLPMDGRLINYFIKLDNRSVTFTSRTIKDKLFHKKLNNLLISSDAINNSNLIVSNNDSNLLQRHKVIEYDSSWAVKNISHNVDIVIGKVNLIKKFDKNQYLYSFTVDSTCSHKSRIYKNNETFFIQSDNQISNLFNNKIGLITIPKNITKRVSKKKYQFVGYAKVLEVFNPYNSYFFEFYDIHNHACFNNGGDIFKQQYGIYETKAEFNELEKTIIRIKDKNQ